MLYFEKSHPSPECLNTEQLKVSGDYKCGCVLERLKSDFKNKCYICEDSHPHTINIEHFRPHKGDKKLMFSWDNLFWSCAHCNNTKLDNFTDILNCTNADDHVEGRLKYIFKPFPFEKVKIETLHDSRATESTRDLIETVFNGTTKLKTIESANLRDSLLKDIREFQNYLVEYFEETSVGEEKDFVLRKIKSHLNSASKFTSFKRWIVRENDILLSKFGNLFDNT